MPDIDPDAPDRPVTITLEDLRGRTPEELYEVVNLVDEHLRNLHQDERGAIRDLDDAEQAAFDQLMKVRDAANKKLEEHRAVQEVLKRRPQSVQRALSNIGYRDDDPGADLRRLMPAEVRDRALRRLDKDKDSTAHLSDAAKTQVERLVRRSTDIARRILVTETPEYREAFMKLTTQPDAGLFLSQEERDAVRAFQEYRAMSENTTTAGGFGIPVKVAA